MSTAKPIGKASSTDEIINFNADDLQSEIDAGYFSVDENLMNKTAF